MSSLLKKLTFQNLYALRCCARFSQAAPAVDKNSLSKLRKETGFAFSNCRKALVLHDNDFDKALEWLHAEAAREGWAKAAKLQGRTMSQGVIGVIANPSNALMLQMNCETDFVARNVQFLELVSNVTNRCFDKLQGDGFQKFTLQEAELGSLMLSSNESVADAVATQVGTLGENLRASRAVYMSTGDDNSYLGHYIHSSGVNPDYLQIEGCKFGKFSSLVRLTGQIDGEDIRLHSTQLAQHIVGMNPKSIGSMEPEEVSKKASEVSGEASEEVDAAGQQPEDGESADELLRQEFLVDPDFTIREWLLERQLMVEDFVRLSVSGDNS